MKVSQPNLHTVDWIKIPAPKDDGGAQHLPGLRLPSVVLSATSVMSVDLAALKGRTVLYIYPMTGKPGTALPEGWDNIPGARGCTPQSCAFRDHHAELCAAGADHVFGLSTQSTADQQEAAERLHLPFALLSDAGLDLCRALNLPHMTVEGRVMLKRMALIIDDGRIGHVFYPVFPPDRNAGDVLAWLKENPR